MCRVDGKKVEVQAAMPAAAAISTFYVYYIPLNGFYFMWSTAHFLLWFTCTVPLMTNGMSIHQWLLCLFLVTCDIAPLFSISRAFVMHTEQNRETISRFLQESNNITNEIAFSSSWQRFSMCFHFKSLSTFPRRNQTKHLNRISPKNHTHFSYKLKTKKTKK